MLKPLLEVIILAIIPLCLIVPKIIPPKYRFTVLGLVGLGIIVAIAFSKIPINQLGLRTDNLLIALPWFTALAVIGASGIAIYARLKKITPLANWQKDVHLKFWFIPISIIQQFVFFSFILSRLDAFLPTAVAVIVNAAIFASAHLMYKPKKRAFVATLLAGLAFSMLYSFEPNLIAGSLAHMVLNFTVVQRNLFSFLDQNGSV